MTSKPYYTDADVTLLHGDCRDVLRRLEPESVDAVVTDPPYHLTANKKGGTGEASVNLGSPYGRARITTGFMGKQWDGGDTAFQSELWAEVLRVLKPGGHLLAFGGSRTYHRMAVAIEDAGFEIRDQLQWLYGSGFPKSLDVSKAIDKAAGAEREVIGQASGARNGNGHNVDYGAFTSASNGKYDLTAPATPEAERWQGFGTALKPAHEPIVLARKPLAERTVAAQVLATGTGAINVDGCRVEGAPRTTHKDGNYRTMASTGHVGAWGVKPGPQRVPSGRWPSNVILSHHPACNGDCHEDCPVRLLDAQSGTLVSRWGKAVGSDVPSVSSYDLGMKRTYAPQTPSDSGGASRFFYCAKASTRERTLPNGTRSHHPTVKPIALMRYLCRLITPPGGIILDPFIGSGTTAIAARLEGFRCIGIDESDEYLSIAVQRLAQQVLPLEVES